MKRGGMQMSRHINAKPSISRDRHDFSANGKRPDGNPSARELIAHAAAARTDLAGPPDEARAADERREAKKPRHQVKQRRSTEADDKALASRDLPTMGELEQARNDHSRKIATQGAEERAKEADKKAEGAKKD
jgi:hypothetical protein